MEYFGIISDNFTFEKVREFVCSAVLKKLSVIVGYDARFLADKFAAEAVKELEKMGISCLLTEYDTPLPAVIWSMADRKAGGVVMITGASRPATDCGIKFIPGSGAGEKRTEKYERFDPRERYLKYLEASVDASLIKRAKLKIVIDPMFGSARGYVDKLFQRLGCRTEEIHDHRDVLFAGMAPDPAEKNLCELKDRVVAGKFDLGIAFNGDASAYAWIDREGAYNSSKVEKDAILEGLLLVEKAARAKV